ncbi:MAG: Mur ligase family protein [Patescibacteria group bacterium]|nr:Mur ligase family protein [Patescibacteria group bacterium]
MNLRGLLSLYSPRYPTTLVYMLQSTEYQAAAYLAWFWRTTNFATVTQRRSLDRTKAARLLLTALRIGMLVQIALGLFLVLAGARAHHAGVELGGIIAIVIYPVLWAYLITLPLQLGRVFISRPAEKRLINESKKIFANHPGAKIAVAGSYGKTTMKELLATVLSEGLTVAATPANKNVSSSHAYFARKLTGSEDVLVIEYGEGAPGDVARFAQITAPTHAVITGLAPAHLDQYKTLAAAGQDILSVANYLHDANVFVNDESPDLVPLLKPAYSRFNKQGALGWKVKDAQVSLAGTSFTLTKGRRSLPLQSGLVGRHQIGFLSLVASLGLQLGLTAEQVQAGIASTKPFEHRMQPYQLSGAWVIDDTYNGNLEGLRAGTQLLAELAATRKIYVTPGLVDQGAETERVHVEAGRLIAAARPDIVVLMKNSVTDFIVVGLHQAGFSSELRIETSPLDFYTNLNHFVAAGDLVLMQNDWTDNYA